MGSADLYYEGDKGGDGLEGDVEALAEVGTLGVRQGGLDRRTAPRPCTNGAGPAPYRGRRMKGEPAGCPRTIRSNSHRPVKTWKNHLTTARRKRLYRVTVRQRSLAQRPTPQPSPPDASILVIWGMNEAWGGPKAPKKRKLTRNLAAALQLPCSHHLNLA